MAKYTRITVDGKDVYNRIPGPIEATVKKFTNKNKKLLLPKSQIDALKLELEKEHSEVRRIMKQAQNPKTAADLGDQKKGRVLDVSSRKEKIDRLCKQLAANGVKVRPESLNMSKIQYVEGVTDMLNMSEVKSIKLDIFEKGASGAISKNMQDYLLTYIEGVENEVAQMENHSAIMESVYADQKDEFVTFVREAYENNMITGKQYEVLTLLANEHELLYESPEESIPELVEQFLEAAEEGNEERKAQIRNRIETVNKLRENVVTEGASCESIAEKLEELKIKLSDEEKAVVEKIDEAIKEKMKGCEEKKPEEDPKEDVKDGGDGEVEGEGEGEEEEPVKESSLNITIADKEELYNYLNESVENGVYTEEDKKRISTMIEKYVN